MSRCSACPGINTCVQPSGPRVQGKPMFIGEAPGWQENKSGIPFTGKTGKETNEHYLPLASCGSRDDNYFTNAILCMPDRPKGKLDLKKDKDLDLLYACAEHHLYQEIRDLQPSVLVCMGAFACHAIDPAIDLTLHHGMPLETKLGIAFPMWHPAGGIHEPKKMLHIRTDWIRLRRYLRGNLILPHDRYPKPDYRQATESDVRDISPDMPMAADTESSRSVGPYCLTYTQEKGKARLIEAVDTSLLKKFQSKLSRWESYIYYHNWPYDWTITEEMELTHPTKMATANKMGLEFPRPMTRDTMMQVFLLGNLPQGLKALAFRLLGMEMQDFEDLVTPYSHMRVLKYYEAAKKFTWPKYEEQLIKDDSTGLWKTYKPQSLNTKLKRLFTDLGKNSNKDLFKMWETWEQHHEELQSRCGPYWGLDIADVPFDKALYYACRDSDGTIRLVPILEQMRKDAMAGKLQELWGL